MASRIGRKAAEIIEMFNSGMGIVEISKVYGVAHSSVARLLRRNGIKTNKAIKTIEFINTALSPDGNECIKWPFGRNNKGYGELRINGKKEYAHRIVCSLVHGPPPTRDHEAAHSCGMGSHGCVNGKHLSWKTTAENCADKIAHGTYPRGENNHFRKLRNIDILQIRARADTTSQKDLSKEFAVSQNLINRIINRRIWKHI